MEQQTKQKSSNEEAWPGLPDSIAHRTSLKWMTLESLRILQNRLTSRGMGCKVLFLTSTGYIQGFIGDILDKYDDSVNPDQADQIEVASATVHIRTELLRVYSERDADIEPIDNGAIIHVHDAVMEVGGRKLRIPHLALFASEVIGFTLTARDLL